MKTKRNRTRALCEGAVMVAMSQLLSYLVLYRMPQGGSLDAAMLPLVVYCVRWGFGWGTLAGFCYGLLQYFIGNGFAISWVALLGDYAIAYTLVGVAGLFKGKKFGLIWGCISGCLARFVVHWVVGATVWGEYMPESFWNLPMTNTWVYSALYNLSYIGPDCLIITILAAILLAVIPKYMRGQDIS